MKERYQFFSITGRFLADGGTSLTLFNCLLKLCRIGSWMPKMDECPAEMATVMKRLQGTSAGQVISKLSNFV